jgi:hypothetical protein
MDPLLVRPLMTTPGSETGAIGFAVRPAVTPASFRLRGDERGVPLAPSEWRSLAAYARWGAQKEAAAELGIQWQTLRDYMHLAYRKLGVTTAIEALAAVGWLRIPGDDAGSPFVSSTQEIHS